MGPATLRRSPSGGPLTPAWNRATIVTSLALLLFAAAAWVDVIRTSLGAPDMMMTMFMPLTVSDGLAFVLGWGVMMTAMNIGNLPAALTRSGRVELWLEMKLPDAEARTDILSKQIAGIPEELRQVDMAGLAAATDGFTGADLKRLVEDAKAIYAYGKAGQVELQEPTHYFLKAAHGVRQNKERFARAEEARISPPRSMAAWTSHMQQLASRQGGEDGD